MLLKNKDFKIILMVTLLIMVTFSVTACSQDDDFSKIMRGEIRETTELVENNPYLKVSPLSQDALWHIEEGSIGGIGFGVTTLDFDWNWEQDGDWNHEIQLATIEDYLVANLENISVHGHNFVMKVFINYESLPFRVKGEEEFTESFMFSVESGHQIELPFILGLETPENNATYKLTVAIFGDPERYAVEQDAHWNAEFQIEFATPVSYDLILGSGGNLALSEPNTKPIARRENQHFRPLQINTNLDVNYFYTKNSSSPPPHSLQVSRNEEIELAWFVNTLLSATNNEPAIVNSYAIVGLLSWQQISLNGLPFLLVDASNHDFEELVDFGTLTITAPDEVGLYEFIAFLVPNPEAPMSYFWRHEMSHRITIEVVE